MVQYIFTPWRDRRELLAVRRQFYPVGANSAAAIFAEASSHETETPAGPEATETPTTGAAPSQDTVRDAVARVTLWMQRGFCPHMVESTALLAGALLADFATPVSASAPVAPTPALATRAAYAAAFARFVTGLLDGQQDRARKMSMHGLAHHIGLPPGFVELRHQVTHEALPSLRRLRAASLQALAWIYGYYWANIPDAAASTDLRDAVLKHIGAVGPLPPAFIARWGAAAVLAELVALAARETGGRQLARVRQLTRTVQQYLDAEAARGNKAERTDETRQTDATDTPGSAPGPKWTAGNLDLAAVRASLERNRQALHADDVEEDRMDVDRDSHEDSTDAEPPRPRWTRYEGDWTPRPIGVVL